MSAADLGAALQAHADSLEIAAEAVRDAADALAAGNAPAAVATTLSLSAYNAVSTALGLARKAGQLEPK